MLPTSLSVHRLLLSGVMLAAKLTDDHYFNNAFYGRVGPYGYGVGWGWDQLETRVLSGLRMYAARAYQ